MLTHIPELEERGPKAQPPIGIASERQPFQGGTKIIVLYLEQTHPFRACGIGGLGCRLFSKHQTVRGMGALRRVLLSAGCQTFQPVLTDCVQQHKTRFSPWMLNLLNEAFVNERCHAFEDIKSEILFGVADRFDSFQSAAADENRQSSEQRLLGLAEK